MNETPAHNSRSDLAPSSQQKWIDRIATVLIGTGVALALLLLMMWGTHKSVEGQRAAAERVQPVYAIELMAHCPLEVVDRFKADALGRAPSQASVQRAYERARYDSRCRGTRPSYKLDVGR